MDFTWPPYEFQVHQQSARWSNHAGIYIFAGPHHQNRWFAYYVGQADNFSNRIPLHKKWEMAQILGATHVHAMAVPMQEDRDLIETHLIRTLQPPLNVQQK